MTKVWEWSKADGAVLLVALALADHADDDGYCYPGVERIAKKCRISVRSVQRHMAQLCETGELEVDRGKGIVVQGGITNRYRLTVNPKNADLSPGVRLSPGDKNGSEVVTESAGSGDRAVSPKPSAKPSVESSGLSDDDWMDGLQKDPAYSHLRVKEEFGKMARWCEVNRKQPTRKRFINWINRIEKPIIHGTTASTRRACNGATGTLNEGVASQY